jgi:hypothetical protein
MKDILLESVTRRHVVRHLYLVGELEKLLLLLPPLPELLIVAHFCVFLVVFFSVVVLVLIQLDFFVFFCL